MQVNASTDQWGPPGRLLAREFAKLRYIIVIIIVIIIAIIIIAIIVITITINISFHNDRPAQVRSLWRVWIQRRSRIPKLLHSCWQVIFSFNIDCKLQIAIITFAIWSPDHTNYYQLIFINNVMMSKNDQDLPNWDKQCNAHGILDPRVRQKQTKLTFFCKIWFSFPGMVPPCATQLKENASLDPRDQTGSPSF